MPSFHFKGKSFLENYHHTVRFHKLKSQKEKGVNKSPSLTDNLLIHGDNLKALKALLPTHAGKVKCVYIDPPYNTGNEGWAYNDNVASPMIQDWLGKVVAKDDLTRHDKWACMMYPRLLLLRELLADDGVIFVSIDENEVHHLRMIFEEIFGEENFINQVTVQSNPRGSQASTHLATVHEYVLIFAKNGELCEINGYAKTEDQTKDYNLTDENGAKYRLLGLRQRGGAWRREDRPNMYYPLYVNPSTGEVALEQSKGFSVECLPKRPSGEEGRWTWSKQKVATDTALLFGKAVNRDGEDGFYDIFRKDYLQDTDGNSKNTKPKTIWDEKELNYQLGRTVLKDVFEGKEPFDYPKPIYLVQKCINMLNLEEGDLILDSFAGSGTTAHAVLALNQEDGGNRKFILVECEDYANAVTAERIRRVIKGVPSAKDEALRKGLGGSFSYYELGEELEMDKMLEGEALPDYDELARYAFFTATGENWDESKMERDSYYIGSSSTFEVFLLYEADKEKLKKLALNLDFAMKVQNRFPNKQKLIFAPACFMEEYHLKEYGIRFAQLPFEIYRMAE